MPLPICRKRKGSDKNADEDNYTKDQRRQLRRRQVEVKLSKLKRRPDGAGV